MTRVTLNPRVAIPELTISKGSCFEVADTAVPHAAQKFLVPIDAFPQFAQ